MGEALVGSDRPFVITSSTILLARRSRAASGPEQDTLPSGLHKRLGERDRYR